jgi:hypothetical protein
LPLPPTPPTARPRVVSHLRSVHDRMMARDVSPLGMSLRRDEVDRLIVEQARQHA